MKKTLIALLACSSLAWAGLTPDEAQQRLQEQLDMFSSFDQGFQFSFEVESFDQFRNTYRFLTLGEDFSLATQTGNYVGFCDEPNPARQGDSKISGWAAEKSGTTLVSDGNTNIITRDGAYSMVWFSYGLNGTKSPTDLTDAQFEILVKDGNTMVTMTRGDGVVNQLIMENYTLKAEDIAFNFAIVATDKTEGNPSILYKDNFKIAPAPEPATGSLSLLALAGLAARRRRK